jgi:hypothetical protein
MSRNPEEIINEIHSYKPGEMDEGTLVRLIREAKASMKDLEADGEKLNAAMNKIENYYKEKIKEEQAPFAKQYRENGNNYHSLDSLVDQMIGLKRNRFFK